ncbi:MAG: sodium:proton antiporter NhaD [Saprospiraceae bacterium]|nr:sodium:proton antiporter NhaD [Saprospiraceae bacterium]
MLTAIIIVFLLGYSAIVFEEYIKINKTASALVTGVLCWTIYMLGKNNVELVENELIHHFSEAAQILFFLLGAMTIVEVMDAHDAFDVLVSRIKTRKKATLLWIIGFIAFFLSAVLDNLTTTIVMISFLRKLINDREDRLFMASIVVIAANAGGAFSPIGDVTTTMLWIGGQVTTVKLMEYVFLPSLVCLVAPLAFVSLKMKGVFEPMSDPSVMDSKLPVSEQHKTLVFFIGIAALIFVPIFKTVTHLPPFMGMLLSLGVMWIATELMHSGKDEEDKHPFTAMHALQKIDTPSILFFAGILLAVGTLQTTGILRGVAEWFSQVVGNESVIAIIIGVVSAIVDNVPLVAASMGMYSLDHFPQDHTFWHFIAYCAGTGGSLLIIGSAAGVAAMGMEKIEFFWYVKRITFIAALGYFAGCAVFILEHFVFY